MRSGQPRAWVGVALACPSVGTAVKSRISVLPCQCWVIGAVAPAAKVSSSTGACGAGAVALAHGQDNCGMPPQPATMAAASPTPIQALFRTMLAPLAGVCTISG
jgi:hypothetical protein